jgi:hypothetical protein
MSYKIGDKVFIPASENDYWTGTGIVDNNFLIREVPYTCVRMLDGKAKGKDGAFRTGAVRLATDTDTVMEIVSIKRTKHRDSGLKVYGQVLGESGKTYRFAYFRRKTFRGWICSCDNFMMSQFAKGLNCKHLQFVRNQVGRYAASVPKS